MLICTIIYISCIILCTKKRGKLNAKRRIFIATWLRIGQNWSILQISMTYAPFWRWWVPIMFWRLINIAAAAANPCFNFPYYYSDYTWHILLDNWNQTQFSSLVFNVHTFTHKLLDNHLAKYCMFFFIKTKVSERAGTMSCLFH